MKRILAFLATLVLTPALAAQAPPPTPTCDKKLGVTWADIRQCMEELRVGYPGQFNGAVFGYLTDGTTTPTVNGVGTAYQGYNTAGTSDDPVVWLGSVTKPFTHMGALLAVERTPVSYTGLWTSIPGATTYFINSDPYQLSRNRKASIRIKDVLTMTAGFGDTSVSEINNSPFRTTELPFFNSQSAQCRQSVSGTTDTTKQLYEEPGLYNECVYVPAQNAWLPARGLLNRPVAQFEMRLPLHHDVIAGTSLFPLVYSNRSSIMAGWLVEQQTGELPNRYVKNNVFEPLNMNRSFYVPYGVNGADADPADDDLSVHMLNKANGLRGTNLTALGLRPCNGLFWCDIRDWQFPWPEGGMHSTPHDVFKFMAGLRDWSIPGFTASTYNRMLQDQLDPIQARAGGNSRTAAFTFTRNGVAGLVNQQTEGSVGHHGFPGASLIYDPVRRMSWFFAAQRVMQHKNYFQVGTENFGEARVFYRLLTSMLENLRPDNADIHFDAAHAIHRNLSPLRYQSRLPGATQWSDAYTACANSELACEYLQQEEFNACNTPSERRWEDLSPNQRTMSISTRTCPWQGNGSRTEVADDVYARKGPFRLRISSPGEYTTVPTNTAPGAFTLQAWVYPHSLADNTIVTRSFVDLWIGDQPTWQIATVGGRFVAHAWDTGGKRSAVGGPFAPGQWYHVVAKATQNGQLSLYVNGVQSGPSVPIGTFKTGPYPSYSIGYFNVNAPGFDVAAVTAYNQEHPAADVLRNCNGLKYRFPGVMCN